MGTASGDDDGRHATMHSPGGGAERVNLEARRPFAEALRSGLAETFFPDDPFRGFGALPPAARAWGALKYFVPALEWAPRYSLDKFKYDLLAGVTIASLAIPQGISYARLANLPPIIGLCTFPASLSHAPAGDVGVVVMRAVEIWMYTVFASHAHQLTICVMFPADSSFVPPLLYAVFGSSNNLAVGTVAAASLMLASIIEDEVLPEDDPERYLQLFYTSAFFTGVFQTALGVFRYALHYVLD
jgi:sulfate transporter 3